MKDIIPKSVDTLEVFDKVLNSTPVIIFALDQDGHFTFSRGSGLAQLELEDHQVVGMHYSDLYGSDPTIIDQVKRALNGEEFECQSHVNGHFFHVYYRLAKNNQVIGIAIDETELMSAREEKDKLLNQLINAYEISREGMWSWSLRTNKIEHNKRWREIFEYTESAQPDQLEYFSNRVHPNDLPRVWQTVEQAIQQGTTFEHQYQIITPSGEKILQDRGRVVYWDLDGNPLYMTGSISDITEQFHAQKQLEKKASTDELTGLSNRFGSLQAWDQWKNQKSENFKAIFALIDFDHFQPLNHVMGYTIGNKILQHFSEALKRFLPSNTHIARIGGDEFLIMAPNHSLKSLESLLKQFAETVKTSFPKELMGTQLQFSCGLAKHPQDGDNFSTLFRRTEAALHEAKKSGRNCFRRFDIEFENTTAQNFALLNKLQSALESQQLFYQLQPQYDISKKQFTGAEVLIRWKDEELGFISPVKFIPLAEQSQLITPITYWLIDKVLHNISELNRQTHTHLKYSINIPAQFLYEAGLIACIQQCFIQHQISPTQICFELTESQLISDASTQWMENIERLRQLGIEFAVDDFGTGYSNLSQLKKLDFNLLKIDKSFIDALSEQDDKTGHALVKAMIGLARTLKLDLIAEGVEKPEQVIWLEALGCTVFQGYHFSKPLDIKDFQQLLLKNTPS
ncbi:EAL domain-containing protein [Thiomicrorhabdus indica]|uniref:EAL domain-containing protein n=1 Tax=Thiomicrorhabdus indica TaxID=2267253 RepID=UPI002AA6C1E8|nr:EAL domain-containing protein [Thiomicrorhabdus indica]